MTDLMADGFCEKCEENGLRLTLVVAKMLMALKDAELIE